MRIPISLLSKWLPGMLLALTTATSHAQTRGTTTSQQETEGETRASLGLSSRWLDNANVNSNETLEEYETTVDFNLTHSYAANWVDFSTDFLLNYVDFQNDTFEDHAELNGDAELNLFLLPERLSWLSSYSRERSLSSTLLAQTDDTEITRGVLQTGPTLTFRLGETNALISASYIQVDIREAESNNDDAPPQAIDPDTGEVIERETNGDTKRYNYSITLQRQVSPLTTFQLGGTYSDTFEVGSLDTTGEEIDRTFTSSNYQLGFTRRLKHGEASFSWGINSVERADGVSTDGTFLGANININSLGGNFSLGATKALTDSSLGLSISTGFTGRLENGDTNFGSSDVVDRERIEVQFERSFFDGNALFNIGSSYDRENFTSQPLDTKRNSANIGLDYTISEQWDTGMELTYRETEFLDQTQFGTDKTYTLNLDTGYEFTANLQGALRLSYASRSNDSADVGNEIGQVDPREYDQTSITLSVQYTLF